MSAISANNLKVTRGAKNILNDVSLAIKEGVITGLIGPSGSGKSTLMRAIVGVQKYDGELTILDSAAGSKSLRSRIGYVTQSPAVYSDLTVKQNLDYFAAIVGHEGVDANDAIKRVRLQKYQNQLVADLSGGQKARVSLAIALLGDPTLLILDEPTVGLDPILRNELWDQFTELTQQGKTILVSSHVMDEADRCQELVLIRDGDILWNDTRVMLLEQTKKRSVNDAFIAMIEGV